MGVPHGKGSSQGDRTDATINERVNNSSFAFAQLFGVKGDEEMSSKELKELRELKELKTLDFAS